MTTQPSKLSRQDRTEIISRVRQVAACHLGTAPLPTDRPEWSDLDYGGVFVTFKHADRLRGCMGTLMPQGPFDQALAHVTVLSLSDPRFVSQPITAEQLPELSVEVSILTLPQRVTDAASLVAGRHGVIVSAGGRTGCLLPQVASERGWDIPTLLSECCRLKAGLPADAWRNPKTRIEVFEAVIVRQENPTG